jgi:transposase
MEEASQHIDLQTIAQENTNLKSEVSQLKAHIQWLEKQLFGVKSEKKPSSHNSLQGSLFDDEQADTTEQPVEMSVSSHKRKKRKPEQNRQPLPEHLERIEEYIEPDFDTTGMVKIGEERTEILEIQPAKLYVRVLVRPKYANGQTVKIPQLPQLPIPQGNAGPSLLAHILAGKYLEHMPLYRQSKRFERNGLRIAASTLNDWVAHSADRLLFVLYKRMMGLVLDSGYVQADETPLKVLDKLKRGKTHRGYLWVYYSPERQIVFFDYQKGRGREGPRGILEHYHGYLQSDGYVAYDEYEDHSQIALLHCMAHARRKFHEALSNDKVRAQHALDLMGQLYGIEKELRECKSKNLLGWYQLRQQVRSEQSAPLLEQFKKWLIEQAGRVLPKSAIGKAVDYSLTRIKTLTRYIQDGRLEIDNNLVENQIRPVALGRKNFLFAGSHQGAIRAAVIYSLIGSCQHHDINPQEWLTDVLTKLPARKANDIDDLLPQNWKSEKEEPSLKD